MWGGERERVELEKEKKSRMFNCDYAYTHFFVCPGKYRRYLLSCSDKYRIVSNDR